MQSFMKAGFAGLLVPVMVLGLAGCGGSGTQPSGNASTAAAPTAPAPSPSVAAADTAPAAFGQCRACHSVQPGQVLVGPSLAGVFGRKAGSVAGFAYSDGVKGLGVTWDEASLDKWLTDPAKMAPGTKMGFAGYADAAQRKAVIDYLKTLK